MRFFCCILLAFFVMDVPNVIAISPPAGLVDDVRSAILMEKSSGQVLMESNADQRLPIASVTKTMTMLLAVEALYAGVVARDSMITVSAFAASMGGSQVFLQEGEQMRFDDIFKAIVIASANDASVALAEHLAGSEEAFVAQMNARAAELGMANTHFINCNGLDDGTEAFSSARDVALMSRELLKHPAAIEFMSIWMDSLRGGEFELVNTNRLVRFYEGATGLKTGSTDAALYCLAASAMRGDMHLIAVVLGAATSPIRFATATGMLDYGFANYAVFEAGLDGDALPEVVVSKGTLERIGVVRAGGSGVVVPKAKANSVVATMDLPSSVRAPIAEGERIGVVVYTIDGEVVATVDLVAMAGAERIGFWRFWMRLMEDFVVMR